MNQKRKIIIILFVVSILLMGSVGYYYFYLDQNMPSVSVSLPTPKFSLCEVDSDCIHIIAVNESGSPQIQPITFQDCINKNYQELELERYDYGTIKEKTGKDLCKCKQIDGLKMCIVRLNKEF